jgi:hypothetical protein
MINIESTDNFKPGDPIEILCYNPETRNNEWKKATFIKIVSAVDYEWRADVEYNGIILSGSSNVAPDCIRSIKL